MSKYIVDKYGNKRWYKDGKLHRLDGPACIYISKVQFWYQDGYLHRLDGAAIEYPDGYKRWYYKGKYIHCSYQKDFEQLIKLRAFC